MFSIDFLRLLADEREREIQRELRVRRLLQRDSAGPDPDSECDDGEAYAKPWRARAPRASATTR